MTDVDDAIERVESSTGMEPVFRDNRILAAEVKRLRKQLEPTDWQAFAREALEAAKAEPIVCPYCGMSTWFQGRCALPGCEGHRG